MNHDNNQANETSALYALVKSYLDQQQKEKRRRFVFKLILIFLVVVVFFLGNSSDLKRDKPHTGIIDVKGTISDGARASAKNVIKALHKAYKAKGMNDVILRINSNGGSPVQADYIFQEIRRLKKKYPKKKVYAVCADVCASAAYYVAAAADEVYAARGSLVGSIGVLYNGFGLVGAMDKVGISRRLMTAGKYKGFLDPFLPESEEDKAKMEVMLKIVHDVFEKSVLEGRGKRLVVNENTFSGLFWTGQQAKGLGLIDGFGSEWDLLRHKTKNKKYINYTIKGSLVERISKKLGTEVVVNLASSLGLDAPLR